MTIVAFTAIAASTLPAQTAEPKFEVASIKPHVDDGGGFNGTQVSPGTMRLDNRTLRQLIRMAYAAVDFQIAGAPEWVNSEGFDIVAKTEGTLSPGRMLIALRTLLEDRFQLKTHREVKEGPVYTLTVAKGGPKLQPWKEGSCLFLDQMQPAPGPRQGQDQGQDPRPMCDIRTRTDGHNRVLTATGLKIGGSDLTGVAVPPFAFYLSQILNRSVIDKTGLSGMFDLQLEFTPDDTTPGIPGPSDSADPLGPSIFAALHEQLGLKLEAGKGPVESLVIDHVEKPSGN